MMAILISKPYAAPKFEFILAQHPWMENDCLFADLLLPVNTKFEEQDIATDCMGGQFRLILNEKQCIRPLGESHSDYEIVCLIAEKLGLLEQYTGVKRSPNWSGRVLKTRVSQTAFLLPNSRVSNIYVVPTDPKWEELPVGLTGFLSGSEKKSPNHSFG